MKNKLDTHGIHSWCGITIPQQCRIWVGSGKEGNDQM